MAQHIYSKPPSLWIKAMVQDIFGLISHRYQLIESEQLGFLTLAELTQPCLQLISGGVEGVVSEAGTPGRCFSGDARGNSSRWGQTFFRLPGLVWFY